MESMAVRPDTALSLIARASASVDEVKRLVDKALSGAPAPESLAVALVIASEGLMEAAAALRAKENDADVLRLARAAGEAKTAADQWACGWHEGYAAALRRRRLSLAPTG